MKTHFKTMFNRVIWESDLLGARITLALSELFWGVMLLWPGETFARPIYHNMSLIMREEFWGFIFLISSLTQLVIVLTNKMHSTGAWFFSGWNFCFWSLVVLSMLDSVYPPPASIGGEIAIAISSGWIWLRPLIMSETNRPLNK